jgi:hypothetical protein
MLTVGLGTARRGVLAALLMVGGLLPWYPGAVATGSVIAPCTRFAAAPGAADHTAYCAGERRDARDQVTGLAFFVTHDGGRNWSEPAALGLMTGGVTQPRALVDLFVSPLHAMDHTVYVQVAELGLFSSTDYGDHFLPVDPSGTRGRLTPFVNGVGAGELGGADLRTMFVSAMSSGVDGANQSLVIDPTTRSHTPITGTPGRDIVYAISPDYVHDHVAYAVGVSGVGAGRLGLYSCSIAFECSTLLKEFPRYSEFGRIWIAPDFATSHVLVVTSTDQDGRSTLWRSTDAGVHFAVWTSAQRLIGAYEFQPAFDFSFPGPARLVYLRTSLLGSVTPPAEQLFVSRNGGVTWTRVSWGREPPATVGTMPVIRPRRIYSERDIRPGFVTATADGRVFVLGFAPYTGEGQDSFYCTVDGGRRWARRCLR